MRGWDMKMGSTEFKKWVPRRDLAPQWARPTLAHSSRIALLTRGVEEPAQALRHPGPGGRRGHPRPGDEHPGGDRNRLPPRACARRLPEGRDEGRGHAGAIRPGFHPGDRGQDTPDVRPPGT